MHVPPLHAAHQVRETFDGLAMISWLAIGLATGALVLTWGRFLAWLRSPDAGGARLVRWGEDAEGLYFELRNTSETAWTRSTSSPRGPRAPRPHPPRYAGARFPARRSSFGWRFASPPLVGVQQSPIRR